MPIDDSPRAVRDRGLQRARLLTHAVTAAALVGTGVATASVVEPAEPPATEAPLTAETAPLLPAPAAQSPRPLPRRTVYVRAAAPAANAAVPARAAQARPRPASRLAPPPAPPAPVRRSTASVATSSGS